ncbi:hypothetical protein [Halodesulfovibrio sp.]|jgi:hypothetical protein|uniref:hypothetical protein n=1 Tax=Halodesulfovibrio sp. TaxID=1912772 RepID=UPI0025F01961|nr:hypothetical protein [Halodesulfovibrio sp.]MCT4625422.1 hypothetical protein [Halodesulfovibrio sp.]
MRQNIQKYIEKNVLVARQTLIAAYTKVRENRKIGVIAAGLLTALIAGVLGYSSLSAKYEEAQAQFTKVQQLVATYQSLLSANGVTKEERSKPRKNGVTLFSQLEELTKNLQLTRRVNAIQAEPSNGQERVRLSVHSLKTFEVVRLLFRIEHAMRNVAIEQAQIGKQKNGLTVNLLIAPS